MVEVRLGRTGITAEKNAFGALPIQRVSFEEAGAILRTAYQSGIHFFDTARSYTDSEEKIGRYLSDVREDIVLASKSPAKTGEDYKKDLETSLKMLRTDYIDIYQHHNLPFCPKPGDGTGLYEAALEAKEQGKIRFIGLTNHRMAVAREAVESGLYDTLQFPFSYLATPEEIALVELCRKHNVGFIAMKALSGGLITNARAAYAYLAQYDNVLPIWGIQRMEELEEFVSFIDQPPIMTDQLADVIAADREELVGSFCRGCGYCMPCPVDIPINTAARMSLMLRRAPVETYTTPQWQAGMKRIENCINCGQCRERCPYGLDTPELLRKNLEDYKTFVSI
jgi:predicted aldo/keto reductase-like oxidoreductase